ncbi:MAG: histidine phosphatase family protein, partial [Bacteroidota bacterium]
RHAESEGNVNNHIIGGRSSHLPLTGRGEVQAQALGQRLQKENAHFDHVYASDAVRAQHTAQIVCSHLDIPLTSIQVTPSLAEVSQGDWEGKVRAEIFDTARFEQVQADPLHFQAPNGESQYDARQRMSQWLENIKLEFGGQSLHIAAFSHGYAIRSLIGHLLEASALMTRSIITHNTSITVLRLKTDQWLIERVNDFSHLDGSSFIDHY